MNSAQLDKIVNAVLYEGYILYPYRPSSKKNCRERFTFGRVYPQAYSAAQKGAEPCVMQTECLLRAGAESPTLEVSVRFLQPMWRKVGVLATPLLELPVGTEPPFKLVGEFSANGQSYQAWQEAFERTVNLSPLAIEPGRKFSLNHLFAFPENQSLEPIRDEQGRIDALFARRQEALAGRVEIEGVPLDAKTLKLTIRIVNETALAGAAIANNDAVLMRTFASTHTILRVEKAEFISLTDPPDDCKQAAAACQNIGTWPVLVGEEKLAERDTMLSSPIILPDYPRIAPESGGDFCDGTEIDEMLTLRVMTMTDEEKREMRHADQFARRILERTETMDSDHFLKMHGTMRDVRSIEEFFNPQQRLGSVPWDGAQLKTGDRVRICPKGRADAMDMMLAGKVGIIEAIEQDAEAKVHLALVLEDDPGKDLGLLRQPGHRFFYGLDEIEPLTETTA